MRLGIPQQLQLLCCTAGGPGTPGRFPGWRGGKKWLSALGSVRPPGAPVQPEPPGGGAASATWELRQAAVLRQPAAVVAAAVVAVVMLPVTVVVLFLGLAGGGTAAGTPEAAATVNPGGVASGASAAADEALGALLAARDGWTGQQVTCLDELWTRESGWRADAKNPQSGAYGIAQALGHLAGEDQGAPTAGDLALNMAGDNYPPAEAAGNPPPYGDSDPAAQITWGLGYIASAYGTPCAAWAHETDDGFY